MIYKILMTFLMLIFVVASIIAALWVRSAIEDRYVKINELPMPEKQSKRIFNFFLYLFIFLSIVIYIVFDMAVNGHISLPSGSRYDSYEVVETDEDYYSAPLRQTGSVFSEEYGFMYNFSTDFGFIIPEGWHRLTPAEFASQFDYSNQFLQVIPPDNYADFSINDYPLDYHFVSEDSKHQLRTFFHNTDTVLYSSYEEMRISLLEYQGYSNVTSGRFFVDNLEYTYISADGVRKGEECTLHILFRENRENSWYNIEFIAPFGESIDYIAPYLFDIDTIPQDESLYLCRSVYDKENSLFYNPSLKIGFHLPKLYHLNYKYIYSMANANYSSQQLKEFTPAAFNLLPTVPDFAFSKGDNQLIYVAFYNCKDGSETLFANDEEFEEYLLSQTGNSTVISKMHKDDIVVGDYTFHNLYIDAAGTSGAYIFDFYYSKVTEDYYMIALQCIFSGGSAVFIPDIIFSGTEESFTPLPFEKDFTFSVKNNPK